MSKLSISARLWLPVVILALVVVTVALLSGLNNRRLAAQGQAHQVTQEEKLELALRWRGLLDTSASLARLSIASADAPVAEVVETEIAATTAKMLDIQKRLESIAVGADETAAMKTIADAGARYSEVRKPKDATTVAQALPLLQTYLDSQQAFVKLEQGRADALRVAALAERARSFWLVVGVLLAIVAGIALSTTFLARSILQPLREVTARAERIGGGDLSGEMVVTRFDEIGDLQRALAAMKDSLNTMVGAVRSSVDSIRTASQEIATGNLDLSQRTEQTASNLQRTANSMTELTSTVQQSADSAGTANQLASNAASVAQRGGAVVGQVVSTMDEINASSKRISDIIGVIDGIAFQTNILALNAAVEAARAGEQGRGFAVVAAEVRSLAQRSAEAAKEIKGLIGTSVDKVETGARLVRDAGKTMNEIVDSVQRVTDIIAEISAGTSEQSQGIVTVNQAIGALDQMTQQNAALVEESAAAAESLKDQALKLADVVGNFRLS